MEYDRSTYCPRCGLDDRLPRRIQELEAENRQHKKLERQLVEKNAELKQVLHDASCPEDGCDGFGHIWETPHRQGGDCEWCSRRDKAMREIEEGGNTHG